MSARRDVAPSSLPIELTEDGIVVEYLDGREAFYHGVPTKREGSVTTAPAKQVHVLVTDPDETRGILLYVNDLNTQAEMLEDTGVGRVMLEDGGETSPFPGVTISDRGMRVVVEVDLDAVGGRVFVFEEDEMGERKFEIVAQA